MIADIQIQEIAVVIAEVQQPFAAVHDMDLMYVGGGCVTGTIF